jgi:hypothetical protein
MWGKVDGMWTVVPIVVVNGSLESFSMSSMSEWGGDDGVVDGAPTTELALYH